MDESLPLATQFQETHGKLLSCATQIKPELDIPEVAGPEAEVQVQVSLNFDAVYNFQSY